MTTSLKNSIEETTDRVAGAAASNRIEGKSKELLSRVLEELGEWLKEPETITQSDASQARAAAADTARRLKEIF